MGIMATVMLLGSLAIGRWLDRWLGSSPWLTLILLVTGALSSQLVLYRLALKSAAQLNSGAKHAVDGAGLRRTAGFALGVLAYASLPPLVGAVVGILLDRLLSTGIILTIVLAVSGFVASVLFVLRLMRAQRQDTPGEQ